MGPIITRQLPWLIFLLSFLFFSAGIRKNPMFFYDEERNSVCAREMAERNDFIVPTFNYELRTDKPPLHYFFMMLSYKIFGVNEFGSRFFSAVFGSLTMLLTFLFIRKYLNIKTAIYTILVLLASVNLTLEFHLAVPDPYLIFFMTAAHYAFFDFYQKKSLTALSLMYTAIGLAVLTKGPVALGLVGMNILLFLLFKRELKWKTIGNYKIFPGILIISLIVLPWFLEVGIATNWQWQREFFFEHNLNRLTQEMEGHGGFFGLTILYVFFAFLPFSFFLIQSFRYAWIKAVGNDLVLFAMIVSLVIVLFFTFSATKLPNYPMPAYPFIALILSFFFASEEKIRFKLPLMLNLSFSILLPISVYLGTKIFVELSLFSKHAFLSLIIPAGALMSLLIWYKLKNTWAVLIALATPWMFFSLLVFLVVFPDISRQDPVQQALPLINDQQPIAFYRRCNSGFPYYLRKPIHRLSNPTELKDFLEKTPQFYLISAAEYDEELKEFPLIKIFRKKDLFESPETVVYKSE